MSDRLTDERVAEYATESRWVLGFVQGDTAKLAREVQEYRALRPDCPTCEGEGLVPRLPVFPGKRFVLRCPDCTDGKMPLDKWVALLVDTLAPLPASLADIALTIPSCSHSDVQEGDCDWLLRAHVRRIDAVLKMVLK